MRRWTFFRVGKDGKADGEYGEEYEYAAREGVERTGGGRWRAEFIHDDDLPEWLRYRGWWALMWAYNPHAGIGDAGESIYVAGLDSVFLRDLDRLARTLDECPADVAGCRAYHSWQNFVFRVRRGSPGARKVWDAFKRRPDVIGAEHKFVERHANVGAIPDGLVVSYKSHLRGHDKSDMAQACVLAFHGKPRPHEVGRDDYMGELVHECWRPRGRL